MKKRLLEISYAKLIFLKPLSQHILDRGEGAYRGGADRRAAPTHTAVFSLTSSLLQVCLMIVDVFN